MDKDARDMLKALVDSYSDHYNVPVDESKRFGKIMAGYTDSGRFYLEAAGEALEDWNWHREAALVRRASDGSVDVTAALAANELLQTCYTLLGMVETGYPEADNDPDIIQARKVIQAAEGKGNWDFWQTNADERLSSIRIIEEDNS